MPRRWRVDGFICHVFNRAAARLPLFHDGHDYRRFLARLAQTKEALGGAITLHGYCVMPNHWHLIICPRTTPALSQFMQRLTRGHAVKYLEDHPERSGAIYQGRFRCSPVQDGYHLTNVLLYVDRNPLKGRLVDRAEDWLWSSMLGHAGLEDDPLLDPLPMDFSDWSLRVNRTDAADALAEQALKRNEPLGEPEWVASLPGEWNTERRRVGRPLVGSQIPSNRENSTG